MAIVVVVLLASCGGGSDDQAAPTTEVTTTVVTTTTTEATTTTQATTTTVKVPTKDDLFLAAIDAANLRTAPNPLNSAEMETSSDEDLLSVAEAVCEKATTGLAPNPGNGFPGRTPAQYLIENEEVLEGTSNGERTKLAIKYICPENLKYLEEALSGNPSQAPALTSFPDGNYVVGVEIEPGTYVTTGSPTDCYWERVDQDGRTIENDFVVAAPQVRVTVASTDAGFTSDGCGSWEREG